MDTDTHRPSGSWMKVRPNRLSDGDVHLWIGDARGTRVPSRWLMSLSPAEIHIARSFNQDGPMQAFCFRRRMRGAILADYLQGGPSQLEIRTECAYCGDADHGKPYVENFPIHFSASHSSGVAVVAVALHGIGIDIESMDRAEHAEAVATHFLSFEENEGDPLATWIRKEACLKESGKGLAVDPRTVVIRPDGLSAEECDGTRWNLLDFDLPTGFGGAVASRAPIRSMAVHRWLFEA